MTKVEDAVAVVDQKKEANKQLAKSIRSYENTFAGILPPHLGGSTFTNLVLAALRKPEIAAAAMNDVNSFITATTHCARLGHQPGTKQFYYVPIKRDGIEIIEGWEGYWGIIDRMFRAGMVASIHARIVYENDYYEFEEGMDHPIHRKPKPFATMAERGPAIGTYAYAKMKDGTLSTVVEMNMDEVNKRRKASRGANSPYSPWNTWPDEMIRKCAVRGLERWVPCSAEFRAQNLLSAARAAAFAEEKGLPAEPAESYVEGEVVGNSEEGWPQVAAPPAGQ